MCAWRVCCGEAGGLNGWGHRQGTSKVPIASGSLSSDPLLTTLLPNPCGGGKMEHPGSTPTRGAHNAPLKFGLRSSNSPHTGRLVRHLHVRIWVSLGQIFGIRYPEWSTCLQTDGVLDEPSRWPLLRDPLNDPLLAKRVGIQRSAPQTSKLLLTTVLDSETDNVHPCLTGQSWALAISDSPRCEVPS